MPKYYVPRARRSLPIPADLNGESETFQKTKRIHGIKLSVLMQYNYQGNYAGIYLEDEFKKTGKFIFQKIISNPDYLPMIYKKQRKAGIDSVKLSLEIQKENLEKLSVKELLQEYKRLRNAWLEVDCYNVFPWFLGGDFLHKHLEDELKKNGLLENEINLLLQLPKLSFSSKEELQLLLISFRILKKKITPERLPKSILVEINKLVKKYYWIPFGYDGPKVYDQKHYLETVANLVKNKKEEYLGDRIHFLSGYEKNLTNEQKKIVKKYTIKNELLRLIKSAHILAIMTDERKECQFQIHVAIDKVLDELADKLDIKKIFLRYLTFDELEEMRENSEKLVSLAEKRIANPTIYSWRDGKCSVFSGNRAQKIYEIASGEINNSNMIQGQVGSVGGTSVVNGVIKILMNSNEIGDFKQNEILVTPMTTPEFVPAMRKALAVITDEGGITCHAAIVSRELGISSIIGTKIATRTLKDGDRVEMDMKKGMIRIIK